jgi:hypothetical protein
MDVVTWTGDGSSSRTISGLGFSPDLAWIKTRNAANSHLFYDIVRGASSSGSSKALHTNGTNVEGTVNDNSTFGYLDSFNSNGFGLVKGSSGDYTNFSGHTYVAWAWDAGSSNATNTSGSITSTVRANPQAGVSVVTYTSNVTAGATIGHGLGVAPKFVIFKARNLDNNWICYHSSLGASQLVALNLTIASTATTDFNSTAPSSTLITLGSGNGTNGGVGNSGITYVAYCFAEIEGFSKFGSYTGNGNPDGPFIYCGFRPRWIMYKRTDTNGNWNIIDAARDTYNPEQTLLRANLPMGDESNAVYAQDFTANGWKIRSTNVDINVDTKTYIFAAFAEAPFKYARAR